jgi:hypothetical protein
MASMSSRKRKLSSDHDQEQENQLHHLERCMRTDQDVLMTYSSEYVTSWGWLMYLQNDPILQKRMCIRFNDGALLTFSYTGRLFISPGIETELLECLKTGKRFILNLLHIKITSEDHANALIFDTELKTLTRFEPHGSNTTMYKMEPLDEKLTAWLEGLTPLIGTYRYIAPSTYCPTGPQAREGFDSWTRLTKGSAFEPEGYCSVWSLLFLHARLLNPDLSNRDIVAILLSGHNLRRKIQSYATFILTKIDKNWQRKCEKYVGETNAAGVPTGEGTLYKLNGIIYRGMFLNGVPEGYGVKTYPDGARHEGDFKNGYPNGRGIYTAENAEENYIGEFTDGYYEGQGTYTQLGFKYVGSWVKNKRTGFGEVQDGAEHYIGGFRNDFYHGKGTLTKANGNQIEGRFQNGVPIAGTLTYPDGSQFEGGFTPLGQPASGVLSFPDESQFNGDFHEGTPFNGRFEFEGQPIEIVEGLPDVFRLKKEAQMAQQKRTADFHRQREQDNARRRKRVQQQTQKRVQAEAHRLLRSRQAAQDSDQEQNKGVRIVFPDDSDDDL